MDMADLEWDVEGATLPPDHVTWRKLSVMLPPTDWMAFKIKDVIFIAFFVFINRLSVSYKSEYNKTWNAHVQLHANTFDDGK